MHYPKSGPGSYEQLTPEDIRAIEACAKQAEERRETDPETLARSYASDIAEAFIIEWEFLYKNPSLERHSEQRHFVIAEDDLHKRTLLHLLTNIGAFDTPEDADNHLAIVTQEAVNEAESKQAEPWVVPMVVEHLAAESPAVPDAIAVMTRHLLPNGSTHSISVEPQLKK